MLCIISFFGVYKNITSQLGEIIYSANKTAEDILAKAKLDAAVIIENANEKTVVINTENNKNMALLKEKYDYIIKEHEDLLQKHIEASDTYVLRLNELGSVINKIYELTTTEN